MKKRLCLALSMVLALALPMSAFAEVPASVEDVSDEGGFEYEHAGEDGVYYCADAGGYYYGRYFYSQDPVTYTSFFNDNDAYPYTDGWEAEDGLFGVLTAQTNVTMDKTMVNNASYNDKVQLAVASGQAPFIIPKIYNEATYVNGGGVVAVSDYVPYMPNFVNFYNTYDMKADVDTIVQEDGKFYRLPGMKETALQDYTFLIRDDIFKAAGYDMAALEKDMTWPEFVDVLKGVKEYMVGEGMVGEDDYIWSDRWCGATSGYGSGGNLLNLIAKSYGITTTWGTTATNSGDLYFDWEADEFKLSATSEQYKAYMTVVEDLVSSKILDPETWTQDDDKADGQFYTGKTALLSTNRSQFTAQIAALKTQLGAGNFETYIMVCPMGIDQATGEPINYQAENSRLECGVMVSSTALKELGEEEFIKLMRYVDWLFYSDVAQTLTKWGVEGVTYTVEDGTYSLVPEYYCGGLTIAQTSDDQQDLRINKGFACGNYMYSGTTALLTSNFSEALRNYYDRMAEYRTLRPLDPPIALSEDDSEMAAMWGTNLFTTQNTWTLRFAEGLADVNADWDTFVAEIEAQNAQNILDMYNDYYAQSK